MSFDSLVLPTQDFSKWSFVSILRNQSSNVEIKFIPRTDANVLMIYKQRNILCNKEVIQEIQKDKK